MRKTILALALTAILGATGAATAEMRVAYVDLQAALNKSEAGKAANAKLNETVAERQKIITEMEVKIKTMQDDIKKQKHLMTEDSIRAKGEEVERLLRDYKRLVADSQEEIKKREQQLVAGILDELHGMVKVMGKEGGYAVIFEQNASRLLYADEAINLTDQLVERFNARK